MSWGAMLDGGFVAHARASTIQQEKGVRTLAVCSQLSVFGGGMERL